jgi:phosphopantetheinyl transferase
LGKLAETATWFQPNYERGIMVDELDVKTSSTSRVLSLKKDKYLEDHRIDGKAVLPGVMGLETMVQTYRAFTGNGVSSIHDIEFQSPVKLPRDKDLEVLTFLKKFGNSADLQLKSKFIGTDGKQLGDLRDHFKSKIVSSKWTPGYPVISEIDIVKLKKQSFMSMDEIYSIFFHGPSYQVLNKLSLITENSVICEFNQPKKPMFEKKAKLETDPLAIEAAFQTAGLHLLLKSQTMGLPSGVKMITLFKAGNPSYIRAYHKSSSDTHSVYDVDVIDDKGVCVIRIDSYEMVHTGSVNKFNIKIKKDGSLHTVHHLAGRIDKNLFLVEVNPLSDVSDQFIKQVFSKAEQQQYYKIKVQKKQKEWLAGKIATKLAVSYYFKLPINDIEIEKDGNKSPYVTLGEKTHVSISHSNGIAMAIVGDETVDVERVEERDESFVNQIFSKKEIGSMELNDPTIVTRLWGMKEAHLKRMRIGLKTDTKKVSVNLQSDTQGLVKSKEGKSTCNSYLLNNWVITVAEK